MPGLISSPVRHCDGGFIGGEINDLIILLSESSLPLYFFSRYYTSALRNSFPETTRAIIRIYEYRNCLILRGYFRFASYKKSMKRKKNQYIPITDDQMFKEVFSDEHLLRQLLERILPDVKIKALDVTIAEHTLEHPDDTHGVRLDVYAENNTHMFSTEMQNQIARYPSKRARYSADMMDTESLPEGAPYHALKDCCVIIITPQDPFREKRMVYVIEARIKGSGRTVGEGRKIIYVNCSGTKGQEKYAKLVPFCRYVMGQKTDDVFVKEIDEKVQYYNQSKDWRNKHMKWEQYRLELIEQGEMRGEKKGIRKAMRMAIQRSFRRLMSSGFDKEQAFSCVCEDYPEYSDKEIQKILRI